MAVNLPVWGAAQLCLAVRAASPRVVGRGIPVPLPLPHLRAFQRRAVEFDEMRDTVNYDLIVVMDAYDRAEVVREVGNVWREGWVQLRQ